MSLSGLNRARLAVAVTGLVCAAVLATSLSLIGGPGSGRRDRRDAERISDMRAIAEALICQGEAEASPARPVDLAEITPACLSPDEAADLHDPSTGAPYEISWSDSRAPRVCGELEDGSRSWTRGWPPFDATTGCVTAALK